VRNRREAIARLARHARGVVPPVALRAAGVNGLVHVRVADVQFLRVDAHDRAIFVVKEVYVRGELAAGRDEDVEPEFVPFGCGGEFGAGEVGEGVEVEAVYYEA